MRGDVSSRAPHAFARSSRRTPSDQFTFRSDFRDLRPCLGHLLVGVGPAKLQAGFAPRQLRFGMLVDSVLLESECETLVKETTGQFLLALENGDDSAFAQRHRSNRQVLLRDTQRIANRFTRIGQCFLSSGAVRFTLGDDP